jgi:hypothetical protein
MMIDHTTARANRALQHIIKYCAENRGTMTDIQREFNRRTKQDLGHLPFVRWLHQDPAKRTEPLLGTGLLLIEVGNKIIEKRRREQAKAETGIIMA